MASIKLSTVYVLGPDQDRAVDRLGLRYLRDYVQEVTDASAATERKLRRELGVNCLTCLDQGYHFPTGTRSSSKFCYCECGRRLESSQRSRRATNRAPKRYVIQVITTGYQAAPQDREFTSWQRAYKEVPRVAESLSAGSFIDVVQRTWDAETYRLVSRWEVVE